MKFIIKLFPEIMIKSDSVRKRFIKILTGNIRNILDKHDDSVAVVRHWDFIEVRSKHEENRPHLIELLQCIPGIHHFLEVEERPFTDLHNIFEQTLERMRDELVDKTFCVRAKRRGKHSFSSLEIERYVGGGLNQHIETAKVKLKNPDVTVRIEVDNDKLLFIQARHEGIGGYPIGTQEDVLSLISGGFDSGVSSYMLIRRGSRVHYCFFNLGGAAHEIGVKQMVYHLWNRYGSSHKVRFIAINFEAVVGEILEKIDNGQMGVVLKRMMVRAAGKVAQRFAIEAIVTGEALGQVSSQTLTNLRLIDEAAGTLVLRPLITHDKEQIIAMAKQIGTEDIAKSMPEFCGVISKNPTVKAVRERILAEEEHFDFDILESAVQNAEYLDIRQIAEETAKGVVEIDGVSVLGENDVILDIRSPEETDENPLALENRQVIELPFYKVSSQFGELDQSKNYVLYCERGVMSKLQALYLKENGFNNVQVFVKAK
ncbi:tRNA 4-thiouridine(8) synthase ThiI [Actinobacillus succinogenes]|uniref:tRNA sulfurtransferase n=1 Tax=Actinobacillus succinogenes (strain ATCC 55618 / DSM 22257 / CCUG 43843 / 130Z) TaxID=339671 RepID=THII_ACTSZ|nr:tRNA uracil 4-sulfurtransferase ThiI [Actinobacillus succinogenes]A6VQ53.1 RecName: Full=tRNA sulfurtransferase; AltName: Full=Sulfur carrier protein ThiS sulfurtransferase; AltName: Full=Thiamine biosynthesis protein ThiI; AltName: Full=tRNA 4-thiouridine synthase [Actinobacillus succinogenes 130Z]ABR75100.1 thiamine biosynthesis/tRNA modification protein ThiI [Actinobacillus succinogenes 130Z]PHI40499.1 tRNA 4-thiouridine(8) synthase ThiI [Actinobacillus succinogenes]